MPDAATNAPDADPPHPSSSGLGGEAALSSMGAPESMHSVEALSQSLEAQLKIEDLIIKSREAQHAKFTVYESLLGVIIAAAVSAGTSLVVARLRAEETSAG